ALRGGQAGNEHGGLRVCEGAQLETQVDPAEERRSLYLELFHHRLRRAAQDQEELRLAPQVIPEPLDDRGKTRLGLHEVRKLIQDDDQPFAASPLGEILEG